MLSELRGLGVTLPHDRDMLIKMLFGAEDMWSQYDVERTFTNLGVIANHINIMYNKRMHLSQLDQWMCFKFCKHILHNVRDEW